jgi:hypothetical protein
MASRFSTVVLMLTTLVGCAPIPPSQSFNPATATYTPSGATSRPAQTPRPPGPKLGSTIQQSIVEIRVRDAEQRAQQQREAQERLTLANAPGSEGWVVPKVRSGVHTETTLGPGGFVKSNQAVQQSVTWACFARFRPDSEALLDRVEGNRPQNTIEVHPEQYQRSVLARGDPTRYASIYPQPRAVVDAVVEPTARYVSTLMSMPGAGAREYQHAQQIFANAFARIKGLHPDDRLLCMQAVLAEQFGGASAAQTEKALTDILRYGTLNGGLSSSCFIGMELARRQAARGDYAGALQRLEGLHNPAIGTQAGHPRMDDVYRDFGCQGARWMQGGIYWTGVVAGRNKQQAVSSYQFCSRSLDRCKLNVLLITADEVKTPAQRHVYIQKLNGLQHSRDRDVSNTASQVLRQFSTIEREMSVFPLSWVQAVGNMVTIVVELKDACVKQYGKEACERGAGSTSLSTRGNDSPEFDAQEHVDWWKENRENWGVGR